MTTWNEAQKVIAQDLFNFCAKHMFKQGEPSRIAGVNYYRTSTGLSDPIGALIGDDQYDPSFEDQYLKVLAKDVLGIIPGPMLQLLGRLQMIHDQDIPWLTSEHMARALNEVAQGFNLDDKVLAEVGFNDR